MVANVSSKPSTFALRDLPSRPVSRRPNPVVKPHGKRRFHLLHNKATFYRLSVS